MLKKTLFIPRIRSCALTWWNSAVGKCRFITAASSRNIRRSAPPRAFLTYPTWENLRCAARGRGLSQLRPDQRHPKTQPGLGQYTLMCNRNGGVLDDLYLYQTGPADFLLVVNASRQEEDFAWLEARLTESPEPARDRSPESIQRLGRLGSPRSELRTVHRPMLSRRGAKGLRFAQE